MFLDPGVSWVNLLRFLKFHDFLIIASVRGRESDKKTLSRKWISKMLKYSNVTKKHFRYPIDPRRKLNVQKTFRRRPGRPGRLLNVLCTLSLRPVSTGLVPLFLLWTFKPFVTISFVILLTAFHIFVVIYWIYHGMPASLINNFGSNNFNNFIATPVVTFV